MMSTGSVQKESWVRTVIGQAEIGSLWQVESLEKKAEKYVKDVLAVGRDWWSGRRVFWEGGHIGLGQSSDVSRYLLV